MSCESLVKLPIVIDKTTRRLPSHGRHQLRMRLQSRGGNSPPRRRSFERCIDPASAAPISNAGT
jgi:hypothetical protein